VPLRSRLPPPRAGAGDQGGRRPADRAPEERPEGARLRTYVWAIRLAPGYAIRIFAATEDAPALAPEALEEELAAQAAHVEAGLCRLLELVAECERRLPRLDEGVSFAGWLA